ncbi:hypothetical protein FZZ93_02065 [Halomonas eurihalina]|uniref:PepSY domain-containing protein n=1 Tax=Halomonas eurihalina TaxID=42566 RepID=A0A5D9DFB6_HALER|nr:hypothetical protein FZZ93_02065 [Halomonas eurihalina]
MTGNLWAMMITRAFSIVYQHRALRRLYRTSCGALLCIALSAPALGDEHWQRLHDDVRRGELVELPVILDWLQAHYAGEILEVEIERDDSPPTYEIEMLGPQGQVVEFEFDAGNGELIGMEGVNINAMRKAQ